MPEMNAAGKLPFFVYGTLLPGQPNYDHWSEEIATLKPAFFPDGRLYDVGPYPMLVESRGGKVKGVLATIKDDKYSIILHRLDALEGFNPQCPSRGLFRRVKRHIQLRDDRFVMGWVYLGQIYDTSKALVIESGDWADYTNAT